jgi:hypothetical protein
MQHAVDFIVPEDTVNVGSGVYHEAVAIRVSGSSAGGFHHGFAWAGLENHQPTADIYH